MATQPKTQFEASNPPEPQSEPSLGDLADLESSPVNSEPSLGDQLGISDDDEHSELLGDISLLEEAIAELESDSEASEEPPTKSTNLEDLDVSTEFDQGLAGLVSEEDLVPEQAAQSVAESDPATNSESSVPTLDEEVELSNTVIQFNTDQEAALGDESIPTLDEVASQFDQPDLKEPSQFAQTSEVGDGISQLAMEEASPESQAIEGMSEIAMEDLSLQVEASEATESISQLAQEEASLQSQISQAKEQLSELIMEDLAIQSQPEIPNDIPSQPAQSEGVAMSEIDPEMESEGAASSSENAIESPLEMPLESDFDLEADIPDLSLGADYSQAEAVYSEPASQLTRAVEHQVKMGNSQPLNLSIPYELHAQLSKKIDGLVIEAATSITAELHNQLTLRMDSLLTQAVESVLPDLMDQFANGLRNEVKEKVRSQLPNIINDVLSSTRLKDKS